MGNFQSWNPSVGKINHIYFEKIDAEFSDYEFIRGTVGMARTSDPDSADSQFFICFLECSHLNNLYTVWGQVKKGLKTLDKIEPGEPPLKPDKIISAKIRTTKLK